MKFFKFVFKMIISFLGLIALTYVSDLSNNKYFFNNIAFILVFGTIIYLIFNYFKFKKYKKEKWFLVFSIIVSVIMGFLSVFGYNIYEYDKSKIFEFSTWFYSLSLATVIYSIIVLIKEKIFDSLNFMNKVKLEKVDNFLFRKGTFWKCMLLMLLSWLPILLAFYPGVFSYDASVQYNDFVHSTFGSGNPPFHSFLVGMFITLGHSLFKSYHVGVMLYSIFQMIVVSMTMSYIVTYLNKRKIPFIYKFVCLLVFMFLPSHSVMSVTTTKDVLFGCFVTLVFIKFIDMEFYANEFFNANKKILVKNIAITIIITFLMLITRHNGLYGYTFALIFLLVSLRKYFKCVLSMVVIVYAMFFTYTSIINYYSTNQKPKDEDITPAMCVPFQQLARVYNYANLTEEDRDELNTYVLKNNKRNGYLDYQNRKSDYIFWNMDIPIINHNKSAFVKMYFKYMKKYPDIYFDAFLHNTVSYWYVGDSFPDYPTYRPYIEIWARDDFNNTNGEIKFDSKIQPIFDLYDSLISDGNFQKIPVVSILMNNAIYSLTMFISIAFILCKKKFSKLYPFMFLLGLMGTNFLGPVSILRYMYYLYLCFPIILFSHYCLIKSEGKYKKK